MLHKIPAFPQTRKKGGESMQLTKNLEQNMAAINEALRDCGDVVQREFRVGGNGKLVKTCRKVC